MTDEEMHELYFTGGWTLQEIADEEGVTRGAIWSRFYHRGWRCRRRGPRKGTT